MSPLLLPKSDVRCRHFEIASEWIDVDTATALVARVYAQLLWRTALHDVNEYSLDTVFVKIAVLSVRDDVTQQAIGVDAWTAIRNLHTAAVRLPRNRTQAAQQMRMQ